MTELHQANIKKELEAYKLSYLIDGEPIAVNFRSLVPELKKSERHSHLIHSYPAKLLVNIPYYFLASDALSPGNDIVLYPFCGMRMLLLGAVLSGRIVESDQNVKNRLNLQLMVESELRWIAKYREIGICF